MHRSIVSIVISGLLLSVGLPLRAQTEVSRQLGGPWPKVGAHASIGKYTMVDLPVKNSQAANLIVDRQHNVWIAEKRTNRVMRYDPYSGDFYPLVTREPNAGVQDLAVDRLGNIWFTQFGIPSMGTKGNTLAVVSAGSGNVAEYRTISMESGPYELVMDPDGFIFSTLYYANKILRVDPTTAETIEYSIPTTVAATEWEGDSSGPTGIASDQNGIIWFTESRANKIGRLDPESGQIREYDIPTKNAKPTSIAVDSRGYPWFTLQDAHKIGQLDPRTGRVREWNVGAERGAFGSVGRTFPTAIAIDANDVVWFSELRNNTICSLDPATDEITKMKIPGGPGVPTGTRAIAIDALGSVWFTDNDRIGKLD